ncbi:hypothetical protein OHD62_33695 [Mesorhizobium sp. YC-39]|uniref:Uncharacterized protein n=1 Tax=Mesorhizobium robiniae TaxID=559315 RepID=A0ABV2H077_9HYPH|nr:MULTISPECIES: hypothetical protein [unclassified Mesorhizobium]MCV3211636.1 hypothetical protein [Mesorhizobium sp. YC-2]MCV3233315.1 hypothetical protein [Mesorhizobium sp. YC-39]MCV3243996.1 hypothetical protein [Mesorhizobium sp. ZC-5]
MVEVPFIAPPCGVYPQPMPCLKLDENVESQTPKGGTGPGRSYAEVVQRRQCANPARNLPRWFCHTARQKASRSSAVIQQPLKISAYKTARSLKDLKTTWLPLPLEFATGLIRAGAQIGCTSQQNLIAPEREFYHPSAIDFMTGRAVSIERRYT